MSGLGRWRKERSEQRRGEMDDAQSAQGGQMDASHSPTETGEDYPSGGMGASQPPEGWSQEEWDHVPQSMRGEIASGKGFISKDAIQKYMNDKDDER